MKADSFADALRMGAEVYHALKTIIKKRYGQDAVNVGDEGGFAPPILNANEPLPILMEAIETAGHKGKFAICMDCAASEAFDEDQAVQPDLQNPEPTFVSARNQLEQTYVKWATDYPILHRGIPSIRTTSRPGPASPPCKESLRFRRRLDRHQRRAAMALEKKSCNALL